MVIHYVYCNKHTFSKQRCTEFANLHFIPTEKPLYEQIHIATLNASKVATN